jgi:hypothetical protein
VVGIVVTDLEPALARCRKDPGGNVVDLFAWIDR